MDRAVAAVTCEGTEKEIHDRQRQAVLLEPHVDEGFSLPTRPDLLCGQRELQMLPYSTTRTWDRLFSHNDNLQSLAEALLDSVLVSN